MSAKFIFFLAVALIFYFSIHILFYLATVYFFSIDNQLIKNILLILFGLLSLGFIFSAIMARFSDAMLVKIYYTISAFWLGWVVYLLIGLILAWLLTWFLNVFGIDFRLAAGSLLIVSTLALCFYGIWKADNPELKNIEVKIKDLPPAWQGKTVIQLSDLHIGDINGQSFVNYIIKQVNALQPEAIFITGDLFDGMDGIHESYIATLENLSAKKGIYFITGNHETYLGSAKIIESLRQSKIRVLDNEFVNIDGLQIVGLSYPEPSKRVVSENIINELVGYDRNLATILLYHEPVSIDQSTISKTNQTVKSYWRPNVDFSAQKNSGVNLQLSGHTHQGQFWPFDLLTKKIYQGYDYGLFTEGDFNLYVSSGVGTWGPPFRIKNQSEIVVIKLN